MKPQPGQIAIIKKHYPNDSADQMDIIAEGGNDSGETFNGSFLVRIKRGRGQKQTVAKFTNGKLEKVIK